MSTRDDAGRSEPPTGERRPEWYEIVWDERRARRGLVTFVLTVLGLAIYLALTGKGDLAVGLVLFGAFLAAVRGWREVRALWRKVLHRLAAIDDET